MPGKGYSPPHRRVKQYIEIRQKTGFEHFPLTHPQDDFSVEHGEAIPIVYINLNTYRCDAIIASSKRVKTLTLAGLKMDHVFTQEGHLYAAQLELSENFRTVCTRFEHVMLWLWQAIAEPVLGFLHREGLVSGDTKNQKVFWVSAGWLSIFSIHVAGDWTPDRHSDTKPSVQERCISSYIPSIKALDLLRRRSEQLDNNPPNDRKILLVGMPTTPGMLASSNLNASLELDSIRNLIHSDSDSDSLSLQILLPPLATTATVKSALASCETAHFACHGRVDSDDPSKSALRFTDWQKTPFNVRTLLNMHLERCQLVVLSACETAANKDLLLQDEGLHIAGAFNMAEVPHAVAGMWRVDDTTSLELVKAFYGSLFREWPKVRYKSTAMALHAGTEMLRVKGVHPLLWGAFVHMGP